METRSLRIQTKSLPCKLDDSELRNKGDELALVTQEINNEDERQKSLKDQMKARMTELTAKQSRLALVVSRREEYRDIEVDVQMWADGQVREVRIDTGEVYVTRPPFDNERQMKFKPESK